MLDSVLFGRDKWLAADGVMAPSQTTIELAAFGDEDYYNDHILFWNDVYGFKMSAMKPESIKNANIVIVKGDEIISDSSRVTLIDIKTVNSEELDFQSDFELRINKDGKVYAFCGWFNTIFDGPGIDKVEFSTSPFVKKTHWMQTLFILQQPLPVTVGDLVKGHINVTKMASNLRQLEVTIKYHLGSNSEHKEQTFYII